MRIYSIALLAMTCIVCAACNRAPDVAAEIARIKTEAQAAHRHDPLSAAKKANDELSDLAIPAAANNKSQLAAAAFLGYYRKNVDGIPAVCKQHGVPLQAFTRSFISVSRPWFDAASKFPGMPVFDARQEARSVDQGREELARIAEMRSISVADACVLLEENADTVVDKIKFSAVMPKLHEQLLGTQR